MKEIDYRDQSPYSSKFYDRRVDSFYTEYGVKCIDSQFCVRIQNIHERIVKIINIPIERMLIRDWLHCGNTDNEVDERIAKGLRAEISIDDYINGKWGGWGNELRITWENGRTHEFFYWNETLVIDPKTGKEDPKVLRKHIRKNAHLHNDIKKNLISNLNGYLKLT